MTAYSEGVVIGCALGALFLMLLAIAVSADDKDEERVLSLYSIKALLFGILICVYEIAFVGG